MHGANNANGETTSEDKQAPRVGGQINATFYHLTAAAVGLTSDLDARLCSETKYGNRKSERKQERERERSPLGEPQMQLFDRLLDILVVVAVVVVGRLVVCWGPSELGALCAAK